MDEDVEKYLGGDIPDDPSDFESGELLADITSSHHRNPCGKCGTRVTRRGYSVQCNRCAFWYHRQFTELTVVEIKRMVDCDWNCGCRVARGVITQPSPEKRAQLFARYVDDIIRTVKIADVDDMMEHANRLHPNIEFTMEMPSDGRLAFLDMLIDNNEGRLTTQWYSKPTDTGLSLAYYACAPQRYKRNIIEATDFRINNATSTWKLFDEGLTKAKKTVESQSVSSRFLQSPCQESHRKIPSWLRPKS